MSLACLLHVLVQNASQTAHFAAVAFAVCVYVCLSVSVSVCVSVSFSVFCLSLYPSVCLCLFLQPTGRASDFCMAQASVYLARSGKGNARRVKARSVHAPARRLARTTISLGPDEGIAFGLRAVRYSPAPHSRPPPSPRHAWIAVLCSQSQDSRSPSFSAFFFLLTCCVYTSFPCNELPQGLLVGLAGPLKQRRMAAAM